MSRALKVHACGPGTTVQDPGRFGWLTYGVSPGGAADILALHEGAALLGQSPQLAALELAGIGGRVEALQDIRIALTGAPMRAMLDGAALPWNSSHRLAAGAVLELGHARGGNYSYLHVGGGIDTPPFLGSRSTHLVARIGRAVTAGDLLPVGAEPAGRTGQTGLTLDPADRFGGGTIRIVPSAQTANFPAAELERLQATVFSRDPRGNRMGTPLRFEGAPFHAPGGLAILSEMVVPGDIQITGDGTPYVLLNECQTTGGYPRIGTVIPADLPRIAQAPAGTPLRFALISRDEALRLHGGFAARLAALPRAPRPRLRDPHDIPDLLSYQLISGVTNGDEP